MSRATNREVMGFFAIGEKHLEAILSLIAPSTTSEARILDPFAGEGDFLLKASQTWNLTPYANELDKSRAETPLSHPTPAEHRPIRVRARFGVA